MPTFKVVVERLVKESIEIYVRDVDSYAQATNVAHKMADAMVADKSWNTHTKLKEDKPRVTHIYMMKD